MIQKLNTEYTNNFEAMIDLYKKVNEIVEFLNSRHPLSVRQKEVYKILQQGESSVSRIAEKLNRHPSTIHQQLTALQNKGYALNFKGSMWTVNK